MVLLKRICGERYAVTLLRLLMSRQFTEADAHQRFVLGRLGFLAYAVIVPFAVAFAAGAGPGAADAFAMIVFGGSLAALAVFLCRDRIAYRINCWIKRTRT